MSISSVITGGFSTPGSASLVITDGFATAGAAPPPSAPSSSPAGVRRSRFLRRGPRLPGYDPEEPVAVVAQPEPKRKRKRISAPVLDHPAIADEVRAIAPEAVPTAPRIYVPGVGTVALADVDDEEEILLMALLQ